MFRWSVKLALDSILLGGFDSDEELLDMLEEYSTAWYIGLDSDPGWRQAILDHTSSLFSLGFDDSRVRARDIGDVKGKRLGYGILRVRGWDGGDLRVRGWDGGDLGVRGWDGGDLRVRGWDDGDLRVRGWDDGDLRARGLV